jgi:hypothetical protein
LPPLPPPPPSFFEREFDAREFDASKTKKKEGDLSTV